MEGMGMEDDGKIPLVMMVFDVKVPRSQALPVQTASEVSGTA